MWYLRSWNFACGRLRSRSRDSAAKLSKKVIWNRWSGTKLSKPGNQNFWATFFCSFWALGKFLRYTYGPETSHVDAWGLVLEIQAVKLSKKVIWNRWTRHQKSKPGNQNFWAIFFCTFGPWVNFCGTYGPETSRVDAWGLVLEIQAAKLSKK